MAASSVREGFSASGSTPPWIWGSSLHFTSHHTSLFLWTRSRSATQPQVLLMALKAKSARLLLLHFQPLLLSPRSCSSAFPSCERHNFAPEPPSSAQGALQSPQPHSVNIKGALISGALQSTEAPEELCRSAGSVGDMVP